MTINTLPTRCEEDGRSYWQFWAEGYEFRVMWSKVGYFTVWRAPKGQQRNLYGKTFWRAADMIANYRTAKVQLEQIVSEAA